MKTIKDKTKQKAGGLGGKKTLELKGREYFSKLAKRKWKLERQKKLSS